MSMFTPEIRRAISGWLKENACYEGEAELHKFITNFIPEVNRNTLHDYVWSNFGRVFPRTKLIRLSIKETKAQLKALYKTAPNQTKRRIEMLLLLKEKSLTKFALADSLNVSAETITEWNKIYEQFGIERLLSVPKNSKGVTIYTPEIYKAIKTWLKHNADKGFEALFLLIKKNYLPEVNHNTLVNYLSRHFGRVFSQTRYVKLKVKESLPELKIVYEKSNSLIKRRINMLIVIKQYGNDGITNISRKAGVDPLNAWKWCKYYEAGGIEAVIKFFPTKKKRGLL
jgi:hypothetical protein